MLIAACAFALCSCNDDDQAEDTGEVMDDTSMVDNKPTGVSETFFQVPSPGEMLTFIKMVGGKNNKNIGFLNPTDNARNYNDARSKALNFGIYSCDLSYCSIFEIGSEALKYFKVVKALGDEIGVSTAIKPEILKRLENNVSVPDSLAVITDDVYFSSFETLEDSRQGPTLALVVAGGWLESMFIATKLAKYEDKSPVIERLGDQKYTLENLLEFLKKHEADPNVASVREDFDNLLAEFNKITEQDTRMPQTDIKGDKGTLGGGKQLVMTREVYQSMTDKISALRNSYTQTK